MTTRATNKRGRPPRQTAPADEALEGVDDVVEETADETTGDAADDWGGEFEEPASETAETPSEAPAAAKKTRWAGGARDRQNHRPFGQQAPAPSADPVAAAADSATETKVSAAAPADEPEQRATAPPADPVGTTLAAMDYEQAAAAEVREREAADRAGQVAAYVEILQRRDSPQDGDAVALPRLIKILRRDRDQVARDSKILSSAAHLEAKLAKRPELEANYAAASKLCNELEKRLDEARGKFRLAVVAKRNLITYQSELRCLRRDHPELFPVAAAPEEAAAAD